MTVLEWILAVSLLSIYFVCLFTVCGLTFSKGYTVLGDHWNLHPVPLVDRRHLACEAGIPSGGRRGDSQSATASCLHQLSSPSCSISLCRASVWRDGPS